MKDLAPHITRQRLVIEGKTNLEINDEKIKEYLKKLTIELEMKAISEPIVKHDGVDWMGWNHWLTSGCQFYAWNESPTFFSIDIYTCKEFSVEKAVNFTKNFFSTIELVQKSF